MNDLYQFAERLNGELSSFLTDNQTVKNPTKEQGDTYIIGFESSLSLEEIDFIDSKYEFWVNENLFMLSDINHKVKKIDTEIVIELRGDRAKILEYVRYVKILSKRTKKFSNFRYVEWPGAIPSDSHVKGEPLDMSTVEDVAALLPPTPWETGMHKKIAAELGISNSKVSNAIIIIIKRTPKLQEELWGNE